MDKHSFFVNESGRTLIILSYCFIIFILSIKNIPNYYILPFTMLFVCYYIIEKVPVIIKLYLNLHYFVMPFNLIQVFVHSYDRCKLAWPTNQSYAIIVLIIWIPFNKTQLIISNTIMYQIWNIIIGCCHVSGSLWFCHDLILNFLFLCPFILFFQTYFIFNVIAIHRTGNQSVPSIQELYHCIPLFSFNRIFFYFVW